jgi:hypothetical protein
MRIINARPAWDRDWRNKQLAPFFPKNLPSKSATIDNFDAELNGDFNSLPSESSQEAFAKI